MGNGSMLPGTIEKVPRCLAGFGMTKGMLWAGGEGERVGGGVDRTYLEQVCRLGLFLFSLVNGSRSRSSDLWGHRQDRCSSAGRPARDRPAQRWALGQVNRG